MMEHRKIKRKQRAVYKMNEERQITSIWDLYEKGQNFNSTKGLFTDTDRNYRFYN